MTSESARSWLDSLMILAPPIPSITSSDTVPLLAANIRESGSGHPRQPAVYSELQYAFLLGLWTNRAHSQGPRQLKRDITASLFYWGPTRRIRRQFYGRGETGRRDISFDADTCGNTARNRQDQPSILGGSSGCTANATVGGNRWVSAHSPRFSLSLA